MRDYLARGVPADRIAVDSRERQRSRPRSTLAYLQAHRVSRVVIVSQYYHLARARSSASASRGRTSPPRIRAVSSCATSIQLAGSAGLRGVCGAAVE